MAWKKATLNQYRLARLCKRPLPPGGPPPPRGGPAPLGPRSPPSGNTPNPPGASNTPRGGPSGAVPQGPTPPTPPHTYTAALLVFPPPFFLGAAGRFLEAAGP